MRGAKLPRVMCIVLWAPPVGFPEESPRKGGCIKVDVILGALGALASRGEIRGTQKAPNPSGIGPKRFFSASAVDWCPPRPGHHKPIARDV